MDERLMLLAMGEISSNDMADMLMEEELRFRENIMVRSVRHKRINFDEFSDADFRSRFRFEKGDFRRLKEALQIPDEIRTPGRYRVTGLEALAICLRRLAYPNRLTDLEDMFGLSAPYLSTIANHTTKLIESKFGHLLQNLSNLSWLNEARMEYYSQAVWNKGAPLNNCWGFLDGTIRPICRPKYSQKDFYSGHKRIHCLKYQSLLCPDGMIVSLLGPYLGKFHDARLLRESGLYDQLQQHAVHGERKFVLYGDPAYPLTELIIKPYARFNLTPRQAAFNKLMSSVRQSVEWGFGKILSQFAFVDFKKNQKVGHQDLCRMYRTAVLLCNCQTCLYGGQTNPFFRTQPPTLSEYLVASAM